MKKSLLFCAFAFAQLSMAQEPCVVTIPDANFKNALQDHYPVIDTNGDGEIQCSEAEAFTGTINVVLKNISDLTGIESFTNITGLNCGYNQITSLDVSANTALTTLGCWSNQITNLDLSLNISLTSLSCQNNPLGTLDVSLNTALIGLICGSTGLTSLDVSANTALQGLNCMWNQLTSIDVSANPNLYTLDCRWNELTSLNIANGNNVNFLSMKAEGNSNLTCIQVDNATYSNANWTDPGYFQKDADASWSENCSSTTTCVVNIPDANFKNALLNYYYDVIDTNGDGEIQCSEAEAVTELSLFNKNISDLTGLEAFVNVTVLDVQHNPITTLDLSANTALTVLSCSNTNLTSLNLNNNTALTNLYCTLNSQLTNLDVSTNTALTFLTAHSNQLTSLDVSANLSLETLTLDFNQLTSLDLSANTALVYLSCMGNSQLTSLNIANGNNEIIGILYLQDTNLTCIQVDNAAYSNTNWTNINYFDKPAGASWSENCALNTSDFDVQKITVYPNPTNGIVNISEMTNVIVFDIQGRKIAENKNVTSLDLSSQTAGIYFAQITTEKGTETIKIIKQ